jgi:thiamine-triphosphatase
VIEDAYYDTEDLSMMKDDNYLRRRNGEYELKLAIQTNRVGDAFDRYEEVEGLDKVGERLNIEGDDFEGAMAARGIQPFAEYVTTRKKYKKGGFTIDVDTTNFDFSVVEIELMADNEDMAQDAEDKIKLFAEEHGLEIAYVEGKLLEYVKRNNPEGYKEVKKVWAERAHSSATP